MYSVPSTQIANYQKIIRARLSMKFIRKIKTAIVILAKNQCRGNTTRKHAAPDTCQLPSTRRAGEN